jgi:hypothetical protein
MGTDGSVSVGRVGRAALRRSFRRRSRKASRRFLRFTVAPDFEIRIGTAVWVPGTCRPPKSHTCTFIAAEHPSNPQMGLTRRPGVGISRRMVTDASVPVERVRHCTHAQSLESVEASGESKHWSKVRSHDFGRSSIGLRAMSCGRKLTGTVARQ